MASTWRSSAWLILALLLKTALFSVGCYTNIFSFGDSLTDTGNFLQIYGNESINPAARLPYGETYFHRPTGRCSDGRLVIDFIAEEFGLPFVSPYLGGKSKGYFRHGANFAVGGSTAMNHSIFNEMDVPVIPRVGFLALQVEWFKELLNLLCPKSECRNIVENAFFLVGEMGINDYSYLIYSGMPFAEIKDIVPGITSAISSVIKDLIDLGAKTLVVPGMIPLGCTSTLLTYFQTTSVEEHDLTTGCITWLNELSEYHDLLLLDELDKLRNIYPNVKIIYADYYGAYISMMRSPTQYGLGETLVACCGGGGPYNYADSPYCGDDGASVCQDPSEYVSWDGLHLTDAANQIMAKSVLNSLYLSSSVAMSCSRGNQPKASY